MAILPGFPGLEVGITVRNVAAREYTDADDASADTSTSVTRYIEGVDGAEFQIEVKILPQFKYSNYDIAGKVELDGQVVQTPLWKKDIYPRAVRTIRGVEAETPTGWTRRNFVFEHLTTEAGKDVDKATIDKVSKLGQITLQFFRIEVTKQSEIPTSFSWKEDNDKISEKALKGKAISQKAGLSTEVPVSKPTTFQSTYIDALDKPFAQFCFRYRSLNDLKAELIIPRSPSPVPLEDRPLEDLTLEETRELLHRQREEAARVKRGKSRVKRERSQPTPSGDESDDSIEIVHSKRRRVETETIDLTSD